MRGLPTTLVFVALTVSACGASSGALVGAAINTSVAAGVSAHRRAQGRCYTW